LSLDLAAAFALLLIVVLFAVAALVEARGERVRAAPRLRHWA
jgi:hypothetical protein